MRYEYRIVPAPAKGVKAKGLKTGEERFAHTLEEVLNDMAAEGWEYQRADTLPSQERSGLTSTVTEWRNVLVFRRPVGDVAQATGTVAAQPAGPEPKLEPVQPAPEPKRETPFAATSTAATAPSADAPETDAATGQGKPPAFLSESAAQETTDEDDAAETDDKPKG